MISAKDWSRDEFKAYVLIHASQMDLNISNEELEWLEEKFGVELVMRVLRDMNGDNDFQRMEKINTYVATHELTAEDVNVLLAELKDVFAADGKYDPMEQALLLFFKKIVK